MKHAATYRKQSIWNVILKLSGRAENMIGINDK